MPGGWQRFEATSAQDALATLENLVLCLGMAKRGKTKTIGAAGLALAIEMHGLAELARRIGVAYQMIQGWQAEGRRFATPAEYCPAVERETGIACEQLRPDVDWAVLRRPASQQPASEQVA